MANLVYPSYLKHLFSGTIDLLNDTIYVALVSGSYTPNTGHTVFGDVSSHQVTDPLGGYVSGGKVLQSKTLTISSSQAVFDAADVTWTTATITNASGAVLWYSGATPATRYLIAWQDIGGLQSSTSATFQIVWNNTNGIFRLGAS